MKRSEMIDKLIECIKNNIGQSTVTQLAEEILECCEKSGMVPPLTLPFLHIEYSHEWDPEN